MPQNYEYWDDQSNVRPYGQPQDQGHMQGQGQVQQGQQGQSAQAQSAPQVQQNYYQPAPESQTPVWHPPAQEAERQAAAAAAAAYASPQQPPQQPYGAPQQVAYVAVPQQPQKKSKAWIIVLIVFLAALAFAAFSIKSCTDVVMGGAAVSPGPSGDSVAVINLVGTIQYDGTECSPEGLKKLLDEAANNSNIKAVVLRVNSGGGGVTASEEMIEYLREFNKPVVVSSATLNASAAYGISSQADYIYVAKSTEIGAIGTVMQINDISGLLDLIGVNAQIIASADSKDSTYGYRALTEEELAYYQRMVDQINDMFIENVAEGRGMTVDEVRALATGLTFTGVDAVENGLADEVGTLEDALDKAANLAGISNYSRYDLTLTTYDFSSLADLLGNDQGDNAQLLLRLLKQ